MVGLLSNLFVLVLYCLTLFFTTLSNFFAGGGVTDTFFAGAELPAMTFCSTSSQAEAVAVPWVEMPFQAFESETVAAYSEETKRTPLYAEPGERLDVLMTQESGCELLGWFDGKAACVDLFRDEDGHFRRAENYSGYSVVNRFGVLQMTVDCPEEEGQYLLAVRERYNKGSVLHLVFLWIEEESEQPIYEKPPVNGFEEAIAAGYVVVRDDSVHNTAALNRFIESWENGENSTIYLVKEGKQGKPIITQMTLYRGRIYAFNDYEAIEGEVFAKEYRSVGFDYQNGQKRYYVEDDDGEYYLLFELDAEMEDDSYKGIVSAITPKEDGVSLLVHGENSSGEFYINFFVREVTKVTCDGQHIPPEQILPGDLVQIAVDPAYQTEVPNTLGAASVEVAPPGYSA